jgi:hypothetical protein
MSFISQSVIHWFVVDDALSYGRGHRIYFFMNCGIHWRTLQSTELCPLNQIVTIRSTGQVNDLRSTTWRQLCSYDLYMTIWHL